LKRLFGVICAPLKLGVGSATRVPDSQHLDLFTADAVVEEIVNPSEVQPLYPRRTCIGHGNADARLSAQKRKSLREFLIEGFWRKRPVVSSHHVAARSICACARFVTRTFMAQLAMATRELREHFLR